MHGTALECEEGIVLGVGRRRTYMSISSQFGYILQLKVYMLGGMRLGGAEESQLHLKTQLVPHREHHTSLIQTRIC